MAQAPITELAPLGDSHVENEWAGYHQAVIHIAWFRDDKTRHLLFGMVELRPSELPPAESSEELKHRAVNKSRSYLHYRRFALPVGDAVGWYESAMDGNLRIPAASTDSTRNGVELLSGGPFSCWPTWPHLTASNNLDFAPDWLRQSRAHFLHLKGYLPAGAQDVIHRKRNWNCLEQWLHFDLVGLYSDYLGAICLVAPNPLYRSIEKSHLDEPNDGAAETIAYKLVARAGQCVDGTRLEIVNDGLRGRMTPVAADFGSDAIQVLNFPEPINKEGRTVTHPRYGLLQWNNPVSLVRQVRSSIDVESRRKDVFVPPRGTKQPPGRYRVSEWRNAGVTVVGTPTDDMEIDERIVVAERRRARAQRRPDQHWFHNAPQDAVQFIRDRIGEARSSLMIADPYFATHEVLAFVHAIQWPEVRVRALTSAAYLKQDPSNAGEQLQAVIAQTFQSYPAPPDIRVLPGRRPALHDRFLVVDNDVWFSGNSLNTIGERAGMVVRLPDPEPVIRQLEGLWSRAEPLVDWINRQKSLNCQSTTSG